MKGEEERRERGERREYETVMREFIFYKRSESGGKSNKGENKKRNNVNATVEQNKESRQGK